MQDIPFIETTIARRVFGTIHMARSRDENAAIVGEPGVGKTRAINAYAESNAGTYLMTVNAVTGNALRDLLREVSALLGIHARGSIADIQRTMLQYDLSGRVLIIDEAQNLKLQALRELLNLHDDAGMTIIFCGNSDVLRRVNVDTGPFAQISDRIGLRERIDSIPGEDADAITNSFGVEGMDAYALARSIGTRFRARALVRVLNGAREQAGAKIIKADHIRSAVELYPQYRSALK
jgi:DNA transposition AAA+ family ATPase